MQTFQRLDNEITNWFVENIGMNKNKHIPLIPYYLGLLPYELYAIPGMFISIILACYYNSFTPFLVHLFPHWSAYSIVSLLKKHVKRTRPGCRLRNKNKLQMFDAKRCQNADRNKSFPSGHTIIASTLATSIYYFMYDPTISKAEKSWGILDLNEDTTRIIVSVLLFAVVFFVALQRVSHGYHHVSDVCVGAGLGYIISSIVYVACMNARGVTLYTQEGILQWKIFSFLAIILASLGLLHFFIYELSHLTKIQH